MKSVVIFVLGLALGITLILVLPMLTTTKPAKEVAVNSKAIEDAKLINDKLLWPKLPNAVAPGSETNENLKVVQTFFAAFAKNDLEGIRQVMAEDVEWHIPGRHPLSGTKRGIPEIMEFFKHLQTGGFKAELIILAANEKYVIDAHRGWSNTGKDDIDFNWVLIYQIEKGKIKRVQNFSGSLYESDEFFIQKFGK